PPDPPLRWRTGVDDPPRSIMIGPDGESATVITPESLALERDGEVRQVIERGDLSYAAEYRHLGGEILVVADGRLFTNMSLAFAGDPEVTIELLSRGHDPIELVDGLIEVGAERPAEALANLKMTALVLHLLLAIAVFYL